MNTVDVDVAPPLSFAPGALLGYRKDGKPFYVIAGGASDDEFDSKMDDNEDDEDEKDEEDEEDEGDDEEDVKEEETKKETPKKKLTPEQEENARLKQRLAKTRQESAARRKKIEQMTKEVEEAKDGSETEKLKREAAAESRVEAEKEYQPWILELAASNALLAAGIKPGKEKRAIKLLPLDEIDFDVARRELSGIEDAVDELKEEWPELFKSEDDDEQRPSTSAPRVKSKDVNGANRPTNKDKKPKTSTEIALERLTGTGRR